MSRFRPLPIPRPTGHKLALTACRTLGPAILLLGAAPAHSGSIEVYAARPLDFGALVVLGDGTKRMAPDGTVSANGVSTVPGQREGPAEFTLRYRPDSPANTAWVRIELAAISPLSADGSTGSVTALAAELPGTSAADMASMRAVRLPPCAATTCETTLRVGGTLSVSGGARQTTFSFPLQVTVRLVAEL